MDDTLLDRAFVDRAPVQTAPPQPAPSADQAPDSEPHAVAGSELLTNSAALVRWIARNNANVLAQRARVGQAQSDVGQSRLFSNPSLDFGWGGINVGPHNPPDLSSRASQNYGVGVHETFEIGKRGLRIEGSGLRLDAERERSVHVIEETTAEARYALGRVVFLNRRLAVLKESLDTAQKLLDVQRTRLDRGDISRNDYDRLMLDTTLLELEMPKNEAELAGARADVRTLIGTDVALDAPGPDLLGRAAEIEVPRSPIDVDTAITSRADHVALRLEKDAAEKDAQLARRKSIPDPQVGVEYLHDNLTEAGNQADTLALTLGIEVPIFDHGQHAGQKSDEHALELAHTLDESIREAHADAETLLERRSALANVLQRLEHDAMPTSNQVLEATTIAFNRGELNLADVLLAQRTHIDVVLKDMDLQFESFAVRNDLRKVLGSDGAAARDAVQGE